MIFIEISKRHTSIKNVDAVIFVFSAHYMMVVYIPAKFHENIWDGIKVIERK